MINIEENEKILGRKLKWSDKVTIKCDACGTELIRNYSSYKQIIKNSGIYRCQKCVYEDPTFRAKVSASSKTLRKDPKYIKKMDKICKNKKYRQGQSQKMKEAWAKEGYRENRREQTPEERSAITSKLWENQEFRDKITNSVDKKQQSKNSKKLWKDKDYIEKQKAIRESAEFRNKVSEGVKESLKNRIPKAPRVRTQISKEERKKIKSEASKKMWANPEFREKMAKLHDWFAEKEPVNHDELKIRASEMGKKLWEDPAYREKMEKLYASEEYKTKLSEKSKKLWESEEYRNKMAISCGSEEYRNKMALICANQPKVSSLQEILYSILDDLGVKYYREYPDKPADPEVVIGPWNFDCVIPRENEPALLIECQGEYWHNQPKAIRNDKSKATYITNNFPEQYELKQIWEHEFKCKERVIETIKYWLGISQTELVDFVFKDVEIKSCPSEDYKLLLSKYHYLANAGRGGLAYGAYLGEELIGVCIFSPLVRQNIRTGSYESKECRELSRLCIHPKYQKKNFTSWFVSRCIKQLDPKYKLIISYCDTTFNHDGATYKACNFKEDGIVPPDYWYVSEDGWVMHKRTLYGHATKMGITEKDYAEKLSYKKVFGKEKLRFIYER